MQNQLRGREQDNSLRIVDYYGLLEVPDGQAILLNRVVMNAAQ